MFADSLRAGSGRNQFCHDPVCTVKNSWWWTEELSRTCRVLFQKYIGEISASSWFYYKNLYWCTVTWTSNAHNNIIIIILMCINNNFHEKYCDIFGPKFSGPPGKPDYQGTPVPTLCCTLFTVLSTVCWGLRTRFGSPFTPIFESLVRTPTDLYYSQF